MFSIRFTVITLFLLQLAVHAYGGMEHFRILPEPQSVEIMKGKGLHYNDLSFIVNRSGEDYPVLGTMLGSLPHKERNGKGVYLSLSEKEVPPVSGRICPSGQREGSLHHFKRTGRPVLRLSDIGTTDGRQP